jgi:hypothetical protein
MSDSVDVEEVTNRLSSLKPPLELSEQHLEALSKQDSRLLTDFKVNKFRENAQKHWDLFYKRNEDRFFKVSSVSRFLNNQLGFVLSQRAFTCALNTIPFSR